MDIAIACERLTKVYPGKPPVKAVDGIDLTVRRGQCFGVLGPNGAGKTTTIEILEGLLPATSGVAEVLGMRWGQDDQKIRERIGVSLQETKLSDRLTVLETLTLFRSFYRRGIPPRLAMERVSLEEKAHTWVKNLSGGQRQRLAVASALVGDPEIIFLDEPTTGLDPSSRRQLWEIIQSFIKLGKTVMLTTHYMDEAEKLCDELAVFDHGKIIAQGSPLALIRSLGGEHLIEFTLDGQSKLGIPQLSTVQSTVACEAIDNGFRLTVEHLQLALPGLVDLVNRSGGKLTSLSTRQASLEDVFVKITGRNLSEDQVAV